MLEAVPDSAPDTALLAQLGLKLCEQWGVVPVRSEAGRPRLAVAAELSAEAREELAFALDGEVEALLLPADRWRALWARARGGDGGSAAARWLDEALRAAVEARASDLHLEPAARGLRCRWRIDGRLRTEAPPPEELGEAVIAELKHRAGLRLDQRHQPQDGRFAFEGIDGRISLLPARGGTSAVVRILRGATQAQALEDLGLEGPALAALEAYAARPSGLLICAGPTGAGKTTTLYALLRKLADGRRKIISVEDPVEYALPGVHQTPVRTELGMSFAAGVRAVLRQAPDLLFVGEIRDAETAQAALQAALTGHAVVTSLHASDAAGVFGRLRELGLPGPLLAQALRLVVWQRLARRTCKGCLTWGPLPSWAAEALGSVGVELPARIAEGRGCAACGERGERGRVGLFGHLEVNPALAAEIHAGSDAATLRRRQADALARDAGRKVGRGTIRLGELLAAIGHAP